MNGGHRIATGGFALEDETDARVQANGCHHHRRLNPSATVPLPTSPANRRTVAWGLIVNLGQPGSSIPRCCKSVMRADQSGRGFHRHEVTLGM